jgi:hypothetical protein
MVATLVAFASPSPVFSVEATRWQAALCESDTPCRDRALFPLVPSLVSPSGAGGAHVNVRSVWRLPQHLVRVASVEQSFCTESHAVTDLVPYIEPPLALHSPSIPPLILVTRHFGLCTLVAVTVFC